MTVPRLVRPMAKSRPLSADHWHAADEPAELLRHLREHLALYRVRGHRRKLRLLGCAAARAVWPLLPGDRVRAAVEAAERHADTEIRRTALRAAHASAADRRPDSLLGIVAESVQAILSVFNLSSPDWNRQREGLLLAAAVTATQVGFRQAQAALEAAARLAVAGTGERANEPALRAAAAHQAALVRDLFGDPFAPVAFAPGWRTAAVLGLARAAHADGAFDRLPILADALEEAGCDAAAVLAHCRGGGPHARGCWVIDGLLGRGLKWK